MHPIFRRAVRTTCPFFCVWLLALARPAVARFAFTPAAQATYADLLALRLDAGRAQLAQLARTESDNGLVPYLANYADVIELLITEDRTQYDQWAPREAERLAQLAANPVQDSPYYLFAQAEVKLQWAFVKLKMGDDLGAAWSIRQAYKWLVANEKRFPDFAPNGKSLGLLRVMIGSVPERYRWLATLLGMRGEVATGLQQMQSAAAAHTPHRLEAALLYQLVRVYLLQDYEGGLAPLQRLHQAQPTQPTLRFFYALSLMKARRSAEALPLLEYDAPSTGHFPLPHLDYLRGEVYLQRGEYARATAAWRRFLHQYKGESLRKDTYYRLWAAAWLGGDEDQARAYRVRILQEGTARGEADQRAQRFAQSDQMPDRALLQARFSYDGGFYAVALQALAPYHTQGAPAGPDRVEYHYRMGRIRHAQGDTLAAIQRYERTLQLADTAPDTYFAPSAALQLGYLYRAQGQEPQARRSFERVFTYQHHPYKTSLDQKARLALAETSQ